MLPWPYLSASRDFWEEGFLSDLLSWLGHPAGSGAALLNGTLKLKYHTLPFARKKNRAGRFLVVGEEGCLLIFLLLAVRISAFSGGFLREVSVSFAKVVKRVRLTKKTPCPHDNRGYRGSLQPIPDIILHNPVEGGDPGAGGGLPGEFMGFLVLGTDLIEQGSADAFFFSWRRYGTSTSPGFRCV